MKQKIIISRTLFVDHDEARDVYDNKAPRFINGVLFSFVLLILLLIGMAIFNVMYMR